MPNAVPVEQRAFGAEYPVAELKLWMVPAVLPATRIDQETKYPRPDTTKVSDVTVAEVKVP